jgi:hypothetical protein
VGGGGGGMAGILSGIFTMIYLYKY